MGTASLIKETKEMKMSYNMDTFSWDGHQIIAINPDFLENERRKVRQMSYLEAADYIMFGSAWSVIFKKIKWVREEKDGKATYTLDNSAAKYYNNSRKTHCFSCADIRLNEGIVRSAFLQFSTQ